MKRFFRSHLWSCIRMGIELLMLAIVLIMIANIIHLFANCDGMWLAH
jgi:hypothetical protein